MTKADIIKALDTLIRKGEKQRTTNIPTTLTSSMSMTLRLMVAPLIGLRPTIAVVLSSTTTSTPMTLIVPRNSQSEGLRVSTTI